jgi:hypothetical protein
MRSFARGQSLFLAILSIAILGAPGSSAAQEAGRLESLTVLRAGASASLALRTSGAAVLVAATSVDARAVVVELVGIAADKRAITAADSAGMISRLAIDSAASANGSAVTRIHVSLARPYRHRLRLSDRLVYVDFELAEPVSAASYQLRAARSERPAVSPGASASGSKPAAVAAGPVTDYRSRAGRATAVGSPRPALSSQLPVNSSGPPPAVSPLAAASSPLPAPRTQNLEPRTQNLEPRNLAAAPFEVNLLSRWVAIRQHLQNGPPAALDPKALAKPWIPMVLRDGTTLFSYGDFAKVNEQVAFMLPFDAGDSPRLEAVSLHTSSLDLDSTAREADAARAIRYAGTRGPKDFDDLLEEVSTALASVPSDADPLGRVQRVEQARRRLLEWPDAHYGYRAADILEAARALDPILNQLRSAAGVPSVDLTLSATTPAVDASRPYRLPTLIDLLENAFRVVLLLTPTQRTTVLQAAGESMQRYKDELPAVWLATGQRRVAQALKSEARLDEAYGKLARDVAARATRAAARGDVRAIADLQDELAERDRKLGGQRPDMVASAMAIVKAQADAAALVRLKRDREAMGADPK